MLQVNVLKEKAYLMLSMRNALVSVTETADAKISTEML